MSWPNRESPAQFENRIKPRVYVMRITRSTMYEKDPTGVWKISSVVRVWVQPYQKPFC